MSPPRLMSLDPTPTPAARGREKKPRKPDPSLFSTHVDEPCPRCGATTRRVGIRIDDEATSYPMLDMCARCKHVFAELPS